MPHAYYINGRRATREEAHGQMKGILAIGGYFFIKAVAKKFLPIAILLSIPLIIGAVIVGGFFIAVAGVGAVTIGAPVLIAALGGLCILSKVVDRLDAYDHQKALVYKELNKLEYDVDAKGAAILDSIEKKNVDSDLIAVGLVWDSAFAEGTNLDEVKGWDMDLATVSLNSDGKVLAISNGKQKKTFEGAIMHSGDDDVGGNDARLKSALGYNESVLIDFTKLPEDVSDIVVGVNIVDKKAYVVNAHVQVVKVAQIVELTKEQIAEANKKQSELDAKANAENEAENESENDTATTTNENSDSTDSKKEKEEATTSADVDDAGDSNNELQENVLFLQELVGDCGTLDGYIPVRFTKKNGVWQQYSIRKAVESNTIEEMMGEIKACLEEEDAINSFSSASCPLPTTSSDFNIKCYKFDRFNNPVDDKQEVETATVCHVISRSSSSSATSGELEFDSKKKIPFKFDDKTEAILACTVTKIKHDSKAHIAYPLYNRQLRWKNVTITHNLDCRFAKESDVNVDAIRSMAKLKAPTKLHVTIKRAIDLVNKDIGSKSDPFVSISVKGMKKTFKTKVIKDSLDPEWNFSCTFDLKANERNYILQLHVYDKDLLSNDSCGHVEFNTEVLRVPFDGALPLKGCKHGQLVFSVNLE